MTVKFIPKLLPTEKIHFFRFHISPANVLVDWNHIGYFISGSRYIRIKTKKKKKQKRQRKIEIFKKKFNRSQNKHSQNMQNPWNLPKSNFTRSIFIHFYYRQRAVTKLSIIFWRIFGLSFKNATLRTNNRIHSKQILNSLSKQSTVNKSFLHHLNMLIRKLNKLPRTFNHLQPTKIRNEKKRFHWNEIKCFVLSKSFMSIDNFVSSRWYWQPKLMDLLTANRLKSFYLNRVSSNGWKTEKKIVNVFSPPNEFEINKNKKLFFMSFVWPNPVEKRLRHTL